MTTIELGLGLASVEQPHRQGHSFLNCSLTAGLGTRPFLLLTLPGANQHVASGKINEKFAGAGALLHGLTNRL
jgi:hypothetical protein